MKRLVIALAAGAAVSTIGFASASVLTVDGSTIQAGSDGTQCDTNGVGTDWGLETDDNTVRSVKVNGIDTACAGAEMFIKVDGRPVMHKTITSAGFEKFDFATPYPAPETINDIKVWIEG